MKAGTVDEVKSSAGVSEIILLDMETTVLEAEGADFEILDCRVFDIAALKCLDNHKVHSSEVSREGIADILWFVR